MLDCESMDWTHSPKPPLPDKPELVYLGGPIDFAPGDARGWREQAADFLLKRGISSFSPAHAFKAVSTAQEGISQRLMAVNFCAVLNSDVCLINLGEAMSVGTSREIHQAILWNIPVVVVLNRTPGHYLIDTYCVSTLDEALALITVDAVD